MKKCPFCGVRIEGYNDHICHSLKTELERAEEIVPNAGTPPAEPAMHRESWFSGIRRYLNNPLSGLTRTQTDHHLLAWLAIGAHIIAYFYWLSSFVGEAVLPINLFFAGTGLAEGGLIKDGDYVPELFFFSVICTMLMFVSYIMFGQLLGTKKSVKASLFVLGGTQFVIAAGYTAAALLMTVLPGLSLPVAALVSLSNYTLLSMVSVRWFEIQDSRVYVYVLTALVGYFAMLALFFEWIR